MHLAAETPELFENLGIDLCFISIDHQFVLFRLRMISHCCKQRTYAISVFFVKKGKKMRVRQSITLMISIGSSVPLRGGTGPERPWNAPGTRNAVLRPNKFKFDRSSRCSTDSDRH